MSENAFPGSGVHIRLRRGPWYPTLAYLFGGLAVVVNVGIPILLAVWVIHGIAGSGGFVWPLVLLVVLAGPCYIFTRFGLAMFQSAHVSTSVAVGPDGFALNDRVRLPWDRVRSVAVTGQGRQARLVVLAEPKQGPERSFDTGRGYQWCRIRVDRMNGTTPDSLRSLLVRQCPEAYRAKLAVTS